MWLRSTPPVASPRNGKRSQKPTRRLIVEALEDRCLLSLTPAVDYAVLTSPIDAVVGDFNRDGYADVATINNSQLSVLHGIGDGTFNAAQTSTIGSGLMALAAADFNGDGKLDLAASSNRWNGTAYEGAIHLFLNNGNDLAGNVTFQAARNFSTGTNIVPGAIAVGDLNGDTRVDIAATQSNGSNVTVLLGNGDGTLKTAVHFPTGSNPGSIAVGHFNNDTKLDLVTANRGGSNSVSLLLNNGVAGNAGFESPRTTSIDGLVQSVAVGDFDENGNLDLAVTSNVVASVYWGYWGTYYDYDGHVNVLLGNGAGSFASPSALWTSTNELGDVTVGDLNSDGHLDIVAADQPQPQYYDPTVLLGHGDGAFDAPYFFAAGTGPYAVMVADLNGDTAPDVATANLNSSTVSVLLNDSDWLPLGAPFVYISGGSVTEGNDGSTTVTFTVSLSAEFNHVVTVDYQSHDGSALADIDYEAVNGTLTFEEGQTSQTVEVTVIGDRLGESTEYFWIGLSNLTNARMGSSYGYANILDDEPLISIDYGPTYVTEGNGGVTTVLFTVRLSNEYDQPVSVNYSTAEGDTEWWYYNWYYYSPPAPATAGADFEVITSRTLTFAPHETEKTIPVVIYGDRIGESSESFSVNLNDPSGALLSSAHAVAVIVDDEPVASISGGASVVEGDTGTTSLTFTVTLSAQPTAPVTVTYATSDGSATAGSDYQAKTDTLTFGIGETSKTLFVLVNGDKVAEYDEYFYVNLTSSEGAYIPYGAGYASIYDNEPRLSISGTSITEGNKGTKLMTFTVTLSAASLDTVTVNYATQDGSAKAGEDYVTTSGLLTFTPGQTKKTFTVAIKGDTRKEYDEYFYVNLQNASSNALISYSYGWGDILNDDGRKR